MAQRTQGASSVPLPESSATDAEEAAALVSLLENRGEKQAVLQVAGETPLVLPARVSELLLRAAREVARGRAVQVLGVNRELTTQQGAEILNVSRPFLIGLLEKGEIPHHKVGSHRRIPLGPLLDYRRRRDALRRNAIKQMAREAQESGLYV